MATPTDIHELAFIRHAESVTRLPTDAKIVPLWPSRAFPDERLLVRRPEDLLTPEDAEAIERGIDRAVEAWSRTAAPFSRWRGVDLAECFRFDLRLVLRDLLKTSRILARALQATRPSILLTDARPADVEFPPYPYLHAVLPLLRSSSEARGVALKAIARPQRPTRRRARFVARQAYAKIVARRAMRLLATGRTPVAVGPYPEFYAPLARVWQRGGQSLVVATTTRSLIRSRPGDGYHVLPFEQFLTAEDTTEVARFRETLEARLSEMSFRDILAEDDPSLASVFRADLLHRVRSVTPELAAVGAAFGRGLDRASHLLLVETASPLAKAAVRFARKSSVPVTVLQHGILGWIPSYRETEGNRVAAWGPHDAEWFRTQLGAGVDVAATGCPRYDRLASNKGPPSAGSLPGIPTGKKVIMYAAQPFVPSRALASPWTNAEGLSMALAAASTSADNVLLVKWHPSQQPEGLPKREDRARPPVVEVHRGDTFACLLRADVLMVMSSTVALEGMFLERPVVFLGPQDPENQFDPPKGRAGLRALTLSEAEQHVRRLQEEPEFRKEVLSDQKKFLARMYSPIDGRAAERVVEFMTRG